jgi:hypothetical protein
MKALSNVTKISITAIVCFFITVTSCKNYDIDNSPEEVSIKMAKDDDFQSFQSSINIIRPVLMGNFLKAKSNEDMQLSALKISKALLGDNTETEINELSKIALLNEKQIKIFKEHLANIKKRRLILREEYGSDMTKEVVQKAYEVKVPQSTKTMDDCVLCIASNCIYCPGASGNSGGQNTITGGWEWSSDLQSCRDQSGFQRCTQRVATTYAVALAAWTLLVVFTEGFALPNAIIGLAAAQANAQIGLYNCKVDFCY